MNFPLGIVSTGMITGVGLSAPASCAAIRSGITAFHETRFLDRAGQWILGSYAPLTEPVRGVDKLVALASSAIAEALGPIDLRKSKDIPLFICAAESARDGRFDEMDETLIPQIEAELGLKFSSESRVIPQGRMAGMTAIQLARSAISQAGYSHCLIAGVDTFLVGPTLNAYESRSRLLTSENSNGFIPGEAASAVLVGRVEHSTKVRIVGLGSGHEPAPLDSGQPFRADGMVEAFRSAFLDAGLGWEQIDFRVSDLNGEQYFFREAALALTRSLRVRKEEFDLWHAADCIGEVGAAVVPAALALMHDAAAKDYAPGPGAICHFSCDGPERAAIILQAA